MSLSVPLLGPPVTRRFLLYSHDSFGLGHLRRNTTLAAALVSALPDVEVLLVSGSPLSSAFPLPARTDVVQLPAVTKGACGSYEPLRLTGELERLVDLRSSLIDATVRSYGPDVMLVDHAPAGMGGELLPVLSRMMRDPLRPQLVLGLREIIDDAESVEGAWRRGPEWDALQSYDSVLVYGDDRVLSTASELQLASKLGRPVEHVGYCAPSEEPADGRNRRDAPLVVVSVGGGGDGFDVCSRYVDYLERRVTDAHAGPHIRSLIVAGPLMAEHEREKIRQRVEAVPGDDCEVVTFEPDMRNLLNQADAVISMGGYNTVVELLAGGIPALIAGRTFPRREQQIRADRLAAVSHLQSCTSDQLTCANPTSERSWITPPLSSVTYSSSTPDSPKRSSCTNYLRCKQQVSAPKSFPCGPRPRADSTRSCRCIRVR